MANKNAKTKIIVLGDTHTGSNTGLTPRDYWSGGPKWVNRQKEDWEWFVDEIKTNGPFDGAIWMGDIVDKGVRNSAEIIMNADQMQDAVIHIVERVNASQNYFVYGTPVHTETKEGLQIERAIAKRLNAVIKGQLFIDICGYECDIRHATASGSGVKTTRGTPMAKEREANEKWYLEGEQILAKIYLRGHNHWMYRSGEPNRWEGFNVPALQRPSTRFGRKLSNIVHYGFGILTFDGKEWPTWKVIEKPKKAQEVLKF